MQEIQTRRLEIQGILEGDGECDVAALQTELQGLAMEYAGLEQRVAVLQGLQQRAAAGAPVGNHVVPNPMRDPIAADAQRRSEAHPGDAVDADDLFATIQYRQAFMRHVLKNEAIPQQYRADQVTTTTDAPAVIPTTVMNRITEKMESVGMILPLVNRTAFKGGVKIPIGGVKPVAHWTAEGTASDSQKATTNGFVTFAYHKMDCIVTVTLEMEAMALSAFEASLVNNVVEAMTKLLEQAIISGGGTNCPEGILTKTPPTGQKISVTAPNYQALIEAEAALPMAYESGAIYCMSKKTFMAYYGLVDDNKQPIARVNQGFEGKPVRTLLGRPVVCCDYVPSFSPTLAANTAFAFLFNFRDYTLNSNMDMQIWKWVDDKTRNVGTTAAALVDGKVVDVNSLVTIIKAGT